MVVFTPDVSSKSLEVVLFVIHIRGVPLPLTLAVVPLADLVDYIRTQPSHSTGQPHIGSEWFVRCGLKVYVGAKGLTG